MKKLSKLGAVTLYALLVLSGVANADIKEGKNGIYKEFVKYSSLGGSGIAYRMDSVTRLCFASGSRDLVDMLIPCENLARRPGWGSIITWVKPSSKDAS